MSRKLLILLVLLALSGAWFLLQGPDVRTLATEEIALVRGGQQTYARNYLTPSCPFTTGCDATCVWSQPYTKWICPILDEYLRNISNYAYCQMGYPNGAFMCSPVSWVCGWKRYCHDTCVPNPGSNPPTYVCQIWDDSGANPWRDDIKSGSNAVGPQCGAP